MQVSDFNEVKMARDALDLWGVDKQVGMVLEELGELVTALCQYHFRGRVEKIDVASEIADVEILMVQLRQIIGNDLVDAEKARKLARVMKRLEKNDYELR